MSSSKYIFTLDLRSVQSQISLPVTQGDTNRTLFISFVDGAKPYLLGENSYAMMSIIRPTGTSVQEFCEVEVGGACVIYNFSQYTCAVSGLHKCQLVLYNAEGKQIASPKFSIDAAPKLIDGDDVVIPDEDHTALNEIYLAEAERRAYFLEITEKVAAGEFNGEVGPEGPQGPPGDDYIFTEEDKADIIEAVLEPIPNGDEVLY